MYKHAQNGKIVVKAELNEKTKTYLLTFEDGKTSSCTSSTFKRWYKKIDDGKEEVEESKQEAPAEETTPEEKVAPVKQKAPKVKKETAKKVSGTSVEEAQQLIIAQVKKSKFDYVITEKNPKTVWVLVNGKKSIGVYVGGKKCSVGMTKTLVPSGLKADRVRNCPISHSFDVAYDNMDKLADILSKIEA